MCRYVHLWNIYTITVKWGRYRRYRLGLGYEVVPLTRHYQNSIKIHTGSVLVYLHESFQRNLLKNPRWTYYRILWTFTLHYVDHFLSCFRPVLPSSFITSSTNHVTTNSVSAHLISKNQGRSTEVCFMTREIITPYLPCEIQLMTVVDDILTVQAYSEIYQVHADQ